MKKILACALGMLALAVWAVPCYADGCGGGGCGTKSVAAASCCDDCGKPSLLDRLRSCFHKNDCCEAPKPCCAPAPKPCCAPAPKPCCEKPKCDDCCGKQSLCDRIKAWKHKNDNCCDTCGGCGAPATAPAAMPAAKPEMIPAPMPKEGEKKE